MIRSDYILRMIEEFMQVLSRINSLKNAQRWQEAEEAVEAAFKEWAGGGPEKLVRLSETELLAKVIRGEPTYVLRQKLWVISTLLKEAGDLAAAQNRPDDSRAYYLKGLDILLQALSEGEPSEFAAFVPKIEAFLIPLRDSPLPLSTHAGLMQHYERLGVFGKAEDALFRMLESEPGNRQLLDLAIAFYHRLESRSDAQLSAGNLPRNEVKAGLAEVKGRLGGLTKG